MAMLRIRDGCVTSTCDSFRLGYYRPGEFGRRASGVQDQAAVTVRNPLEEEVVEAAEAAEATWAARAATAMRALAHPAMSFCGGVGGAYALSVRGGFFGAAETTNLIELVIDGVDGNLGEFALRFAVLATYILATAIAYLVGVRAKERQRVVCLVVELACVAASAAIPTTVDPLAALLPTFFMSAFQWVTFTDAEHYGSSTIFSTNNLKQAVISTVEVVRTGDANHRARAAFFWRTLAVFHVGVLVGYLGVLAWGAPAILLAAPVMLAVLAAELAR